MGGEVKVLDGNAAQAQFQLYTWWLGAGTVKLRKLLKKAGGGTPTSELTKPLLGWTIVGHSWELCVALGKGNEAADEVCMYGPVRGATCPSYDFVGVFKLLRLCERIKDWTRDEYWPWFCKKVLDPLKGVSGIDDDDADEDEES